MRSHAATHAPALLLALALAACAGPSFVSRDGRLWHPAADVGVPDLSQADWGRGWTRVPLAEADVAFAKPGSGVIAVRVRCGEQGAPLERAARDRWLGISRERLQTRPVMLQGHPGIDSVARVEDLDARMLVAQVEECTLDVARVAPRGAPDADVFERFLAQLAFERAVSEGE